MPSKIKPFDLSEIDEICALANYPANSADFE